VGFSFSIGFSLQKNKNDKRYWNENLVELKDKNGNNFVVELNTDVPRNIFNKESIQINSIRSVYPKDNEMMSLIG